MFLTDLEKSILFTLFYYNILEIPLTSFEIWKYLINLKRFNLNFNRRPKLFDVLRALEKENLKRLIIEKNGYYFTRLEENKNLVKERIRRQKITDLKLKRFRKYLKIFAILPFVKMIGLTGSISLKNLKEDSDWDIFFIIDYKRLYFTTLLIAFLVILFNKRRTQTKTKDKICLNYFISTRALNIKYHSLYTAQVFQRMKLIYSKDNLYFKFKKKNNWVSDYFYFGFENQKPFIKLGKILNFFKSLKEKFLGGYFGDLLEFLSKKILQLKIQKSKKKYKLPGRVIADDFQIEYHPASPEFETINNYNQKLKELGFSEFRENNSGLSI